MITINHGIFKRETRSWEMAHKMTRTWLRKRNLKRETKSLAITAQNNALKTNYVKVKIDNTSQNIKCRLCGDRDETVNHIIKECSKLAQKEFKTRHNWVGKAIHREQCKRLKFDHTNKGLMHKLESLRENETHIIFRNFEIQMDHLILDRKSDIVSNKKKMELSMKWILPFQWITEWKWKNAKR